MLVFIFQINAVKSLAQMLRRYTGLNHLAQAARAVLQNSSQVSQMLNDLNKVDFTNVQEQVIANCLLLIKITGIENPQYIYWVPSNQNAL